MINVGGKSSEKEEYVPHFVQSMLTTIVLVTLSFTICVYLEVGVHCIVLVTVVLDYLSLPFLNSKKAGL